MVYISRKSTSLGDFGHFCFETDQSEMANFDLKFLDLDDDLSLLTQEDKPEGTNIPIDDMENVMDSSLDSAVGSLASFDRNCSEFELSDPEVIDISQYYKPIIEDINDAEE